MVRVLILRILTSIVLLLVQTNIVTAEKYDRADAGWMIDTVPYLISPPQEDHPIKIKVAFNLSDLAKIEDSYATFSFTGVLKLSWLDPRNAFDPNVAGVEEKTYSGDFQFNELSTGWYPQLSLLNESEHYEERAIVVKIQPNGTTTILRSINASAKTRMDLTYYPFDSQKFQLIFGAFGYDTDQIILEAQDIHISPSALAATTDEYSLDEISYSSGTQNANILGFGKLSSTFIVDIDLSRKPGFVIRTVIAPMLLIVLLTFSIFWFDVKSIQDRISVSFIGLLTITAYQLVVGDFLPHVPYFTLIQGIVIISLVTISISIIISMYMNHMIDTKPELEKLNQACKMLFPFSYIISLFAMYATLSPLSVP
jgi:hypothetical protein